MKKNNLACIVIALFLVMFVFSGITATTTAKGVTVSTSLTFVEILYSLSSTAAVLFTLVVAFALIALISYLARQNSVGFLFVFFSAVLFFICLVLLCTEKNNYMLYNTLSDMLKEAGAKGVKKRDVTIIVHIDALAWATIGLAILSVVAGFPKKNGNKRFSVLKKEVEPFLFVGPHLVLFLLFFLIPTIYGIYAAFTKWDIFGNPTFVGFNNLRILLFEKNNTYYRQLRNGLWNTIKFVLYSVPGCIIFPLLIALALRTKFRGNKFFQGLFYLPALMSASSVMLAWEYFFTKTYGMLNNFFGSTVSWFEPPYSWIMVVLITIWWCTGGNMVIFQSALAGIPQDYYEAASIDGAGPWQSFWHVTVPSMRYPLAYTLTTSVVAQFNVYAQVDILLGYDNSEANAVLMMYIRDTAFSQQVAGMASAMALILGLCIALATVSQVRIMQKEA